MLSAAGASLPAYADPQSPAAQLDAAIRQRNIAEATRLLQATDVAPSAPVEIPDKRRFSTDEMNTALQTALMWLPEVVPLLIEKALERMSCTSSAAARTSAPLLLQDWLIGSLPGRERMENYAREPPLYSALRRGRVREARFLWGVILVVVLGIDLEQLPVEYALASEVSTTSTRCRSGSNRVSSTTFEGQLARLRELHRMARLQLAEAQLPATAREGFVKGLRMQFGRVIAAASTARNLESEDDVIDLVDFVFGEVLVHLRDVLGVSGAEVRQLAKVGLGLAKPASNQTSGAWEPEVVSLLHVVASGSGSVAVCHRLLEHYDRLVVGPTTASTGGHPQESETAQSGLTSCRFQGTKCDELLRKRCATRYRDAVLREVRARMPVGGGPGYRQGGLVTTPWLEDDGWDSLTAAVWYGNWRVVCWLVGVASFPDPLQERAESGSGGAASGGVVTAISNRPQDGGVAASPNMVQTPTEWQRNLVNGQNWQQLTALDFVQHRIEKLEAAAAAPEEYEEKTYEFADEKSGKKVSHAWIGQRGRHGFYDRRTAQQLLNDLRRCELVLRKCGAKNGGGKHSRGGGCEGGCVVQ